jgi:ABC-type glycerol-3-phosphate transport system substrate-binding protein
MKKALVAMMVFAVLCVGTAFAGGGKEGGKAASSQKVKLTIWGRDLLDGEPDHAYATALIKNFAAQNPDIELDYIAQGDPGLMDKTKVAMAAGTGPDIFQSWGGSVMGGYADAGRLLDLTAELKSVPGSAAASGAMSWKGKTYGVAPFFAIAGVYVNEGLFQTHGLAVPKTVEELEKVCDILVSKKIQPFACGAKDKWPPLATYMYLVNRFGGNAFGEAQSRAARFDAEPFVKAAAKMQEWVKKGYFGATPLGEAYGDAQVLMATGKAAMQVTGSWMCAQFSNKEFTDQTIGLYPFPVILGGAGAETDVMGMTDIGWVATKLAADKKDAVVRFMKYAMSVEAGSAEPGRISSVPGVKAPSRLTEMGAGIFAKAKMVQFWWDQDLPPNVTSPLNDTIQTFFLAPTNVKSSLSAFEKLAEEAMGPAKK